MNTKTMKITENVIIECEYKRMRDGFNHYATLIKDNETCETVKIHYINRTWERFEFQSAMHRLAEKSKHLTTTEKELIKSFDNTKEDLAPLKMLSAIMQMTDLFNDDIKAKNDSKLRMLKAQMGNALIMPDDWETIPEEEKANRLMKIQNML